MPITSWVKAIQVIALAECKKLEPSSEFNLRGIKRWYSKNFHTPLHLVNNIPEYDILQAYYEETYSSMDQGEINNEIARLLDKKDSLAEAEDQLAMAKLLKQAQEEEAAKDKIQVMPPEEVAKEANKIEELTDPAILASLGISLEKVSEDMAKLGKGFSSKFVGVD